MSDPKNLQELADSLAAQAESLRQGHDAHVGHGIYVSGGSYRDALLDTRATVLAMIKEAKPVEGECPTCGAAYGEMDHAPEPCLHKAEPDDNSEHYSMCKHCGEEVKRVPGGQGPTWVHEATGMVVG